MAFVAAADVAYFDADNSCRDLDYRPASCSCHTLQCLGWHKVITGLVTNLENLEVREFDADWKVATLLPMF